MRDGPAVGDESGGRENRACRPAAGERGPLSIRSVRSLLASGPSEKKKNARSTPNRTCSGGRRRDRFAGRVRSCPVGEEGVSSEPSIEPRYLIPTRLFKSPSSARPCSAPAQAINLLQQRRRFLANVLCKRVGREDHVDSWARVHEGEMLGSEECAGLVGRLQSSFHRVRVKNRFEADCMR